LLINESFIDGNYISTSIVYHFVLDFHYLYYIIRRAAFLASNISEINHSIVITPPCRVHILDNCKYRVTCDTRNATMRLKKSTVSLSKIDHYQINHISVLKIYISVRAVVDRVSPSLQKILRKNLSFSRKGQIFFSLFFPVLLLLTNYSMNLYSWCKGYVRCICMRGKLKFACIMFYPI